MTVLEQILTAELLTVVLPIAGLICWAGVCCYRWCKTALRSPRYRRNGETITISKDEATLQAKYQGKK